MAHDCNDRFDAALVEIVTRVFDDGGIAEGKEGLESAHAAGFASSEDDSDYIGGLGSLGCGLCQILCLVVIGVHNQEKPKDQKPKAQRPLRH